MHKAQGRLGRWFVWTIALAVLYEILEDSPTQSELIAGVAIAAVAGAVAVWSHATATTRYAANWGDLRRLHRVPGNIVRDTFTVGAAILRSILSSAELKGTVEVFPFEFGDERDPDDAIRRALVTLAINSAPNTLVCMMEKNELTIHRLCGLVPPPERKDVRWPI